MLTKTSCEKMKLREGSMRASSLVHNGGWYNSLSDKLGWGDLAAHDFKQIQENLADGEIFVILGESDSFWNFVTHNTGVGGFLCKTKPEEQKPGVKYLAEKARWIITKDAIYLADAYDGGGERDGITYQDLKREKVAALLKQGK